MSGYTKILLTHEGQNCLSSTKNQFVFLVLLAQRRGCLLLLHPPRKTEHAE